MIRRVLSSLWRIVASLTSCTWSRMAWSAVRRKNASSDVNGFWVLMDSALELELSWGSICTSNCSFLLWVCLWLLVAGLPPSFSLIQRVSLLGKGTVNSKHLVLFICLNSRSLEASKKSELISYLTFSFYWREDYCSLAAELSLSSCFFNPFLFPLTLQRYNRSVVGQSQCLWAGTTAGSFPNLWKHANFWTTASGTTSVAAVELSNLPETSSLLTVVSNESDF